MSKKDDEDKAQVEGTQTKVNIFLRQEMKREKQTFMFITKYCFYFRNIDNNKSMQKKINEKQCKIFRS
jgi:hypothetical protein